MEFPRKKPLRVFAAALIVLVGACVVLATYIATINDQNAAERDFIGYWAAGQLLAEGQNPYDFDAVRRLEVGEGRDSLEPTLVMRNPPVAFFLVFLFGFAGPKASLIAWLAFLMAVLSGAVFLIWRLNGSPDSRFHLMGYAFAPALACLMAGQFGIVMLLGVVLFLWLFREQPFAAGAALSLCSLKPHYFLPFAIVLVLWCVTTRSYRIVAGFCAAVGVICAAAYRIDSHGWSQFAQMMQTGTALNDVTPDLSAQLRFLVNPHAIWIQFVLEVCACIWAVWYFWSRRSRWNWMDHGLVLVLVGAVCTPYGWFFDESVLLPAVLAGVYRATESRRPIWPLAVIAGAALAELLMNVDVVTRYYLWTTPAWLGWYLYAKGDFQTGSRAARA